MPVAMEIGSKGPDNPFHCPSGPHMEIFSYIIIIIIIDKIVIYYLPIDGKGCYE